MRRGQVNGRALAGILALLLAIVHVVGARLRFLDVVPRSRWLSGASGVSVAYVFVHVLPDLAESQPAVRESRAGAVGFVEHHVYVIALLRMMTFYGLAKLSHARAAGGDGEDATGAGVFWTHVVSFALYNLLIECLLVHRERPGARSLLFFFAAMGTHFLVNNFGQRQGHKRRSEHLGRWLLAAAVLAAARSVWRWRSIGRRLRYCSLSWRAASVLKEELPEKRKSNFWTFAVGAAGYTALLLAA